MYAWMRQSLRMETKNVRIRPETHALLAKLAHQEGMLRYAIMHRALVEYSDQLALARVESAHRRELVKENR